ncbi:MAG: dTDP-4-dehydrorhamnose reductase [Clostridia bacterium]|nr:dTDP-4-dehydrorhamnose reductase [Clostridia bacterium]
MLKENGIDEPILSDKDLVHPTLKDNKVIFKRGQERFLVTGYKGQLGYDIKRELLANGICEENILAIDKEEMDITNLEEVMKVVTEFKPDVIFHCAAWTAVDKAEEMEDVVNQVNVIGTRNMVEASKVVDAKIIYLSTDYVFDGTKEGMYIPEDEVHPMSVYGKTKYLGEEEVRKNPKHFIARISWVFGINGNNFIKTMLKLAETHSELNVVDDQIGSPTYTVDLAHLLVNLAQTDSFGTYHVTNEEYCSWADFAEYIFKINHKDVKVNHVSTEKYLEITNTKQAYRPRNSKMDKVKLEEIGLERLPSWQDATKRFCQELDLRK